MIYPNSYGAYTLLESIGQGGMSEIDLAQTTVSDANYVRFLVIKRIQNKFSENNTFVRMFQDEARINAELQHANIAQVYEFGQVKDEFFIAMEYIPGVDLREIQKNIVRRGRFIPTRITLKILADVLDGLHYAHTRVDTFGQPMHVVHRDVNPRNVMLSTRGEVKLIDFGVAKADTKVDQTVGHTLKGKFAYMAPEQIDGESKIDGRADLFAVTLMLHEMVENKRPFAKMNEVQIMHRILAGNIPKLEGPFDHPNPGLIRDIHQKGLQTHADDRYASAKEMREVLIEAAKPIGGIASSDELAHFLRDIIPDTMNDISNRLENYRREITNSHSIAKQNQALQGEATIVTPEKIDSQQASPKNTALLVAICFLLLSLIGGAVIWMWGMGDTDESSKVLIKSKSETDEELRNQSIPIEKEETKKTIQAEAIKQDKPTKETKKRSQTTERRKNKRQNDKKSKTKTVPKKEAKKDEFSEKTAATESPIKSSTPPKDSKQQALESAYTFFSFKNPEFLVLYVDDRRMGRISKSKKLGVGLRTIKVTNTKTSKSFTTKLNVKKGTRNVIQIPDLK